MTDDGYPDGCAKLMNRDELQVLEASLLRGAAPRPVPVAERKSALAWSDQQMRDAQRRLLSGQPLTSESAPK